MKLVSDAVAGFAKALIIPAVSFAAGYKWNKAGTEKKKNKQLEKQNESLEDIIGTSDTSLANKLRKRASKKRKREN